MEKKVKRDKFQSQIGFTLACIGSAVGMGNIWLFPYRVGQFGGAAFLIPYFIFVLLLGFTGVIGEISLGRAMGTGSLGAFKKAFEMRGKRHGDLLGLIPVIGSLAIAIGYSVIVAWILRFLVGSLTGSVIKAEDSAVYFGEIAGNFGSVSWHLLGLGIVFLLMIFGVSKGIERVNKVMMPAFFLLFLILAIRVSFLPNVREGYEYLFLPNWEMLANPKTWVYALGQSFFSLSLAGSGTVVYGSYLGRDENIIKGAKNIAFFDTLAALLASLVIIPSVFAFGLDPMSGPPLMFIVMPTIFKQMPMGQFFSILFFVAVLFASVTSLMNLFETPIEALQEKFHFSRTTAVAIIASIAMVVGIFIESGDTVSKWMDVVSIYIVPLGAMLAGIVIFWVCKTPFAREEAEKGYGKKLGKWFEPMTKYVFVGLTVVVYILGIFYGGIG